jgi:hypothetical protein
VSKALYDAEHGTDIGIAIRLSVNLIAVNDDARSRWTESGGCHAPQRATETDSNVVLSEELAKDEDGRLRGGRPWLRRH